MITSDNDFSQVDESERTDAETTKALMPPADIVTFNEMRSCSDLARLAEKGLLEIKPDFQRGIVWSIRDRSLFVDSLIKQLPIPSICVSLDSVTGKRRVIDGLQRLYTIISFINHKNADWKLSDIDGIDTRLAGRMVSDVYREQTIVAQSLEDVILPINVIRCDYSRKEHRDFLFQIFSRLNSGGRRLRYQEIRNCIYQGEFNSFLKDFVRSDLWLRFTNTNIRAVEDARFGHEERVLRFFAFKEKWTDYNSSVVKFLNAYMDANKDMKNVDISTRKELLEKSISFAMLIDGKKSTRKNWNAMEGILIGIASNIEHLSGVASERLTAAYNGLMQTSAYGDDMREGVMHSSKVLDRIRLAVEAFRTC